MICCILGTTYNIKCIAASYPVGTSGPFLGVKHGWGVTLTTHPLLVLESKMSRNNTSSPSWHLHGVSGTAVLFYAINRELKVALNIQVTFDYLMAD
jgi:hypothetical protein